MAWIKKNKHWLFLLVWVSHFVLYFITESLIPEERCYVVHLALDDVIPFLEVFIVPYTLWYLALAASTLYFALRSPEDFTRMMKSLLFVQLLAMSIYVIFPTRQTLRPTEFLRDNAFTDITALIYSADTSTGVCPSLHVGYSVVMASAWLKDRFASPFAKAVITAFFALVCVSVVFVKQHSALDVVCAMPICAMAELWTYRSYWRERLTIKREQLRTT